MDLNSMLGKAKVLTDSANEGVSKMLDEFNAALPTMRALGFSVARVDRAYNPHWGGHDHVASLLCEPNEIVEHEAAPGFPRTEEDSEELRVSLFEDAYPDYDRGVGVYAGHDPVVGRMALDSIGGRRSPIYSRIEERLQSENYFEVEKEFKRYLSKFGPALSATIPAGSLFYRARIGITNSPPKAAWKWRRINSRAASNPASRKIAPRSAS